MVYIGLWLVTMALLFFLEGVTDWFGDREYVVIWVIITIFWPIFIILILPFYLIFKLGKFLRNIHE